MSDMSGNNPYPYGSGEHFAFEIQERFGIKPSAFALYTMSRQDGGNVSTFLSHVLDTFNMEIAQFCTMYLDNFEVLPSVSDETKQRVVLAYLDFDEDNDPDLGRFGD